MKSILCEVFDWIKTFMIILIAVTIVHRFIFTPVKVDGASMYPTLHDEDTVILWQRGYEPNAFDVVVFEVSTDKYYVKRIIGLLVQTIAIDQN